MEAGLGRIVVLNGAPRSGKSSIADVIQRSFDGVWLNLSVNVFAAATSGGFRPGLGPRAPSPQLALTLSRPSAAAPFDGTAPL